VASLVILSSAFVTLKSGAKHICIDCCILCTAYVLLSDANKGYLLTHLIQREIENMRTTSLKCYWFMKNSDKCKLIPTL